MGPFENLVLVKSTTRLERLKSRFNTLDNAQFYLKRKKQEQRFHDLKSEDYNIRKAIEDLHKRLQGLANIKVLDKHYLPNYLFSQKDLILVVGQDGLVANTAKYADEIPIIGINPDPDRFDGVLLPFTITTAIHKVRSLLSGGTSPASTVTMAEAKLDDGQRLLAFNDLFIGPKRHSSARYILEFKGQKEAQSSSGIIVSTGAGSTGWMSSLINMANGINGVFGQSHSTQKIHSHQLSWDASQLLFAVREPFLSKTSSINITAGGIDIHQNLRLESQMPNQGVIFSDGIQDDFLEFTSGRIASIGIAKEKAILIQ